jgi:hypothetical protein
METQTPEEPKDHQADRPNFCPSCGTPRAEGAVFCIKCGTKLIPAEDAVTKVDAVEQTIEEPTPELKPTKKPRKKRRQRSTMVWIVAGASGCGLVLLFGSVILLTMTDVGSQLFGSAPEPKSENTPTSSVRTDTPSRPPVTQTPPLPTQAPATTDISTPSPTPKPTATITPTPTVPQPTSIDGQGVTLSIMGDGEVSLLLENHAGVDLCYVYLRPAGDLVPTQNLLEQIAIPLLQDDTGFISGLSPGRYDLSISACTSNLMAWADGVQMAGQVVAKINGTNVPSNMKAELTLINESSTKICSVWVGPPYSEWMGDILGGASLSAGKSTTVEVPVNVWAIQARDCSGNAIASAWSLDITRPTEWRIIPGSQ